MLHRILNLSNIYGTIAFISMICVPGAVESEMYITSVVLIAMVGIFAYLSLKEDGQKKNRPSHRRK